MIPKNDILFFFILTEKHDRLGERKFHTSRGTRSPFHARLYIAFYKFNGRFFNFAIKSAAREGGENLIAASWWLQSYTEKKDEERD